MFKKQDNQLKAERYVGLSAVIILLLVLMFFVINLALFMRKANEELYKEEFINLEEGEHAHKSIMTREGPQEYYFNLVAEKDSLVEDGLRKAKIPYSIASSLKDIKEPQGHIILDGSLLKDASDLTVLRKFISDEKIIIFFNMPEQSYIKENKLEEILGISHVRKKRMETELNLVPGFMLGGFHEFKDMAYESTQVRLLGTTKVYGFGKDQMPIIWRNTYKGSEIYLVNGPFMETNASYGVLSALMGEIYEDYIYPVINARLMTYDGFPYLSYENTENLENIYNRNAMKLQNDILLPDILTINKRRDFIPNGFLAPGFNQKYSQEIGDYNLHQINSSQTQFFKEGGEVGMRCSGDLEYDRKMYHTIFPDAEIKSILLKEPVDNREELLDVLEDLESVVGPWGGTHAFEHLGNGVTYIPYTLNGRDISGQEELEFVSAVTAFGVWIQNLDIGEVVMVEGNLDKWKPISQDYMKLIDRYRSKFRFLQDRNITKTANASQVFRNNIPEIKISPSRIKISFENWYGKSYYILKSDKRITNITNGTIKQIEEGAYLITATDREVEIGLEEKNK